MLRVDGMLGVDFLLTVLWCLDYYKRYPSVCPGCSEMHAWLKNAAASWLGAFMDLKLFFKEVLKKTTVKKQNASCVSKLCCLNSSFSLFPQKLEQEPEEEDFYSSLDYLLRFLNHNGY